MEVLPPLSVGEMTLRLYAALNYSQNSDLQWCGIARGKFYDWRKRYGKVNEHNGLVPRDHWIEEWERQSVIDYFDCHPLDGYRRLTFMMLDEDVVAVSPSTTYRVLSKAGRLDRWNPKPSKKGTGFVQPLRAHQHWHTDISYLNLVGRSTTSARFWMVRAARWFTGRFVSRSRPSPHGKWSVSAFLKRDTYTSPTANSASTRRHRWLAPA